MQEKKYNRPIDIIGVDARESRIRSEREERVRKKLDRIKSEGYADRQIKDTLSKVEKIRTEL